MIADDHRADPEQLQADGAGLRGGQLGALGAVLQACGFARRRLRMLLFWETTILLLFGSALGGVTALVTAIPHVGAHVPWGSLVVTLAAVLGAAAMSNALAVQLALHTPLLPAVKGERA